MGETLLNVARRAGVPIDAPCAGNGACGKCRVLIKGGEVKCGQDRHLSKNDFDAGYRLSCISEVVEDLIVFVPQSALAWQNQIRVADFSSGGGALESFEAMKNALLSDEYMADPMFAELELDMCPPSPDDAMADRERLIAASAEALGVDNDCISFSLYALRKLPQILREKDFRVSVLVRKGMIIDVCGSDVSGSAHGIFGVAVDIGTTTVSAALVDMGTGEIAAMGSAGNAQIRFGADVITRLIEGSRPGGVSRLREALVDECLCPLIAGICEKAGVEPEQIYRTAVAGNTTMMHLFLGVYGNNIRLEPYVPAFFSAFGISERDLGLGIHPDSDIILAPSVGSYVGGDITAGVFASGIAEKESMSLFIDLGTNGELVFGNSDFLMACACSAGPAFEGGEIACGMRATDGAITAVTIDAETMEPTYDVIGDDGQLPAGLCGSGLIDIISELFRAGIINAKGKFAREGERIRADEWGLTRYTVMEGDKTLDGGEIYISDADIDNFIRAKGSVFSAVMTMLNSVGMEPEMIENVYLAGGIGSGINIGNAIAIGMLPKLPEEHYHYIGNTSLSGAYAMLVSDKARDRINEIANGMTYLELSSVPGYMDEFIAACFLPHTDASLFE
ncbi:MAG: ASKHA domain-containing protein [Acidobacteriota bacterium]|nr:ASKHA domain-containing protein [Acidobacteriota bacterium]